MIKLLLGVDLELRGDVHVLIAAEHLGIDPVGDDGLIFPGKVFRFKSSARRSREISLSFVLDFGLAITVLLEN